MTLLLCLCCIFVRIFPWLYLYLLCPCMYASYIFLVFLLTSNYWLDRLCLKKFYFSIISISLYSRKFVYVECACRDPEWTISNTNNNNTYPTHPLINIQIFICSYAPNTFAVCHYLTRFET